MGIQGLLPFLQSDFKYTSSMLRREENRCRLPVPVICTKEDLVVQRNWVLVFQRTSKRNLLFDS